MAIPTRVAMNTAATPMCFCVSRQERDTQCIKRNSSLAALPVSGSPHCGAAARAGPLPTIWAGLNRAPSWSERYIVSGVTVYIVSFMVWVKSLKNNPGDLISCTPFSEIPLKAEQLVSYVISSIPILYWSYRCLCQFNCFDFSLLLRINYILVFFFFAKITVEFAISLVIWSCSHLSIKATSDSFNIFCFSERSSMYIFKDAFLLIAGLDAFKFPWW